MKKKKEKSPKGQRVDYEGHGLYRRLFARGFLLTLIIVNPRLFRSSLAPPVAAALQESLRTIRKQKISHLLIHSLTLDSFVCRKKGRWHCDQTCKIFPIFFTLESRSIFLTFLCEKRYNYILRITRCERNFNSFHICS